MKKITFFYFLLFSGMVFAQMPEKNGKFIYENVVQVENASQNVLYKRALLFFAMNYKSANDVIQMKDEAAGSVVGKGVFKITYYTRNPIISHTISVFVKDGRYKYVITDFYYKDNQDKSFWLEDFPKIWFGKQTLYSAVNVQVENLINNLAKFMSQETETESDDW